MTPRIPVLISLLILLALSANAFGEQRFPPPEFESGHTLPETVVPGTRALPYEYLDLGILIATLSVATYLALKQRSRRGIFIVGVFSLIYFGFWRKGCVCSIGSIQNVVLALFDSSYTIPLAVLGFFAIPVVFTLFFGRTFCAGVCPLGAIQDVVLLRSVRVPRWLGHALGVLPFLYLGAGVLFAATGSAFIICKYDPFVAFFRRTGSLDMLLLGTSFLLLGMFVGRPYCRYLCPYGAILNLASRASKWHVKITPRECIQCRLCEDACTFGAIEFPSTPDQSAAIAPRQRFQRHLILLPVLLVLGGWLGLRLGEPFSRMHTTVRLMERVWQEDAGEAEGVTEESKAFRATGRAKQDLYDEAGGIQQQFRMGTSAFGAFAGLVIGLKLLGLSMFRSREDYEANRGTCVSCARCFDYCPVEQDRLKEKGKLQLPMPGRL